MPPFFIDWGMTPTPARSAPGGCSLVSFRAGHPAATDARAELERLDLDLSVSDGPRPALIATLMSPRGEAELR